MPRARSLVTLIMSLAAFVSVFAEEPLRDPGIPDGETVTYAVTIDRERTLLTQRTAVVKENGRTLYEVTSASPREDLRFLIDPSRMTVEYAWARRKKPDLVVETETRVVKNSTPSQPDEILLTDFTGLVHLLRGFPFGKKRTLRLRSAQGGDFSIQAAVTRETEVKIGAVVFACYEVELGMEGFFGAFLPKTLFWFNRQAPHVLIRYQGQTGGPGSPSLVLELTDYKIEKP